VVVDREEVHARKLSEAAAAPAHPPDQPSP
jgi:hypothetical protein